MTKSDFIIIIIFFNISPLSDKKCSRKKVHVYIIIIFLAYFFCLSKLIEASSLKDGY